MLVSDNVLEMEKLLDYNKSSICESKEPKTFIGMELSKVAEGLKITQDRYARKILERFGMEESKFVKTPIVKQDDIQEGDL